MAYGNYGGVAYPAPNYYNNGFNSNGIPDPGNRFAGQYQQNSVPISTMPMQQMPQAMSQQMGGYPTDDRIWVQGDAGAKAYLVARGSTVTLWDSESKPGKQIIYVKTVDINNVPSMHGYFLTEISQATAPTQIIPMENFVTREEFSALEERLNALTAKEQAKPVKSSKTKEDVDNG